jgi:hypothetical protein
VTVSLKPEPQGNRVVPVSEIRRIPTMTKVTYEIVEHDGGWAYKLGDVFSETFRTRDAAVHAAEAAAAEQQVAGTTDAIEYQDSDGNWHQEIAEGGDRPEATVSGSDQDR